MAENKLNIEQLQALITRAALHRWLGLRILDMTEEGIEVGVTWREEFVVNPERRYTHGGILATVIDISGDYALAAKVGQACPTIDLRVDYHRAAMPGDIKVSARVVRLGGTIATAEAYAYDTEGRLLASGRGAYHTGVLKQKQS